MDFIRVRLDDGDHAWFLKSNIVAVMPRDGDRDKFCWVFVIGHDQAFAVWENAADLMVRMIRPPKDQEEQL